MNNMLYDNNKVIMGITAVSECLKTLELNFIEAYQVVKALNAAYEAELKKRVENTKRDT